MKPETRRHSGGPPRGCSQRGRPGSPVQRSLAVFEMAWERPHQAHPKCSGLLRRGRRAPKNAASPPAPARSGDGVARADRPTWGQRPPVSRRGRSHNWSDPAARAYHQRGAAVGVPHRWTKKAGSVLQSGPDTERSHRAGLSRSRNQQLSYHASRGANALNRRVNLWQFIFVLAVAIVLALVISIVLSGVPAP
jgi:hypothetical protein